MGFSNRETENTMPEMDATGSAVAYAIGVPLVLALILIEAVYSSVKGKQLSKRKTLSRLLHTIGGRSLEA